jgi:hypothetical protein
MACGRSNSRLHFFTDPRSCSSIRLQPLRGCRLLLSFSLSPYHCNVPSVALARRSRAPPHTTQPQSHLYSGARSEGKHGGKGVCRASHCERSLTSPLARLVTAKSTTALPLGFLSAPRPPDVRMAMQGSTGSPYLTVLETRRSIHLWSHSNKHTCRLRLPFLNNSPANGRPAAILGRGRGPPRSAPVAAARGRRRACRPPAPPPSPVPAAQGCSAGWDRPWLFRAADGHGRRRRALCRVSSATCSAAAE